MNKTFISVALGALAVTSISSANLVTVACTGTGAGRTVNVTHGTTTANVFAGQIKLTLSNSTGFNLNGMWKSFCTELSQFIYINGAAQTYSVLSVGDLPIPGAGMGSARANAIARMYAAAGQTQFGTNNDVAAGFQIAVWEVSMDYDGTAGSLNVTTGSFKGNNLSSAVNSSVATFLNAAANTGGLASNIVGIGNASFQDQILDLSNGIPAPGALALLGLAGVVGSRRRK